MAPRIIFLIAVLLALVSATYTARQLSNNEGDCRPSGTLQGSGGHRCSECCEEGKSYPQYKCSPPITSSTKATLTVNNFEPGGDGGAPSECDNQYHNNTEHVVALSTGWYSGGSRCGRSITISANGRSVTAKVVDECDSVNGCDSDHAYEPPCNNNIVDASSSVWTALGISSDDDRYGYMDVTWGLE